MLLAIDTSFNLCAVSVYDHGARRTLAETTEDIGRGHAEILPEQVNQCLASAKIDFTGLTRLAVAIGPGSFTGVRVGMAMARGFALALSLPLVGVSTLEACIAHARELGVKGPVAALLDARRGMAYCQIAGPAPFLASYKTLSEILDGFEGVLCGSGAPILLAGTKSGPPVIHACNSVPIETVARTAALKKPGLVSPEPLYLRRADAKVQSGFALARKAG